jgi:SAM-dependent methyltransferase
MRHRKNAGLSYYLRHIARAVRFGLYPIPVLTHRYIKKMAARHKSAVTAKRLCLDIGAGTSPYRDVIVAAFQIDHYFSLDIARTDSTRILADARFMPVADQSISHAFSLETLQHIPDVGKVFDELQRVLVPGGLLLISFPFMFGECEIVDCNRWTMQGMENELTRRGFRILDSHRRGGMLFAFASALHLAVQLVIPGGRETWRRRITPWTLARNVVVMIFAIPTALLGWVCLLLDHILSVKTLNGFYQGGFVLAER